MGTHTIARHWESNNQRLAAAGRDEGIKIRKWRVSGERCAVHLVLEWDHWAVSGIMDLDMWDCERVLPVWRRFTLSLRISDLVTPGSLNSSLSWQLIVQCSLILPLAKFKVGINELIGHKNRGRSKAVENILLLSHGCGLWENSLSTVYLFLWDLKKRILLNKNF